MKFTWVKHTTLSPETWYLVDNPQTKYVGLMANRFTGEWVVNRRDDINFGAVLPAGLTLDEAQAAAKMLILTGAQA